MLEVTTYEFGGVADQINPVSAQPSAQLAWRATTKLPSIIPYVLNR